MSTTAPPDAGRHRGSGSAPPSPLAPSRCSPRTWRRWRPSCSCDRAGSRRGCCSPPPPSVLLVLGVVFQGLGRDPRSDRRRAPAGRAPTIELPADVGRDWEPDDLSTAGPPRPRRRRHARRRSSSSPSPRRTSTAGPGCRRRSAAPGRRRTASSSSAPRSAPARSTRSTPTATATRSWCSTTTTRTAVGGGGLRAARPRPARRAAGPGGARGPRPARPSGDVAGPRQRRPSHYDMVRVHDVLVRGRARCCPPARSNAFARASGNMTLLRPETIRGGHLALDPRRRRRPAGRVPSGASGAGAGGAACRATPTSVDDLPYVDAGRHRDSRRSGSRSRTSADGDSVQRPARGRGGPEPGGRGGRRPHGSATRSRSPTRGSPRCSPTSWSSSTAASVFVTSASDPRTSRCSRRTADQAGLSRLQAVGRGRLSAPTRGRRADVAHAERGVVTVVRGRRRLLGGVAVGAASRRPRWPRCRRAPSASTTSTTRRRLRPAERSEGLAEGEQVDARAPATSRDRGRGCSRGVRRPCARRSSSRATTAPSRSRRARGPAPRTAGRGRCPHPMPWAAGSTASIRNSPSSSRPISRHGEPGGQ